MQLKYIMTKANTNLNKKFTILIKIQAAAAYVKKIEHRAYR